MNYRGLEAIGGRATPLTRESIHAFVEQRTWGRDGRIRHFLRSPIHHFVSAEQYFTPEACVQDEVAHMHHALGLRHEAGTIVQIPGSEHLAVFAVERTAEQGAFRPRELTRLNRLYRHLAGAAQIAHYLAHEHARQATAVLQRIQQPAAVLDRRGAIMACNALFETDCSLWAEHAVGAGGLHLRARGA